MKIQLLVTFFFIITLFFLGYDHYTPAAATFIDVSEEAGFSLAFAEPSLLPPIPEMDNMDEDFGLGQENMHYLMAGGVAAGDFDNDGWIDIYLPRLFASDVLYKNNRDGTFDDVTEMYGLGGTTHNTSDAVWGDIDNDGDLDLYLTTLEGSQFYLYINNNGIFTEESSARGAAISSEEPRFGYTVIMADYNKDGWMDIYTTEWRAQPASNPHHHARLLKNIGESNPGYFEDVTDEVGLSIFSNQEVTDSAEWPAPYPASTFTFDARFVDLDSDGNLDLVTAGDFGTSHIFWNDENGIFSDGTEFAGYGTEENGMGLSIADYNQDGAEDIFITSIYLEEEYINDDGLKESPRTGNRLWLNNKDRTFTDVTDEAGVRDGGWGWGAVFFDFDNDDDADLFMTNGFNIPMLPERFHSLGDTPDRLWRNDSGTFTEVAAASGISTNRQGRSVEAFDYDNDGDTDLFIVNNNTPPTLFKNTVSDQKSIMEFIFDKFFKNR